MKNSIYNPGDERYDKARTKLSRMIIDEDFLRDMKRITDADEQLTNAQVNGISNFYVSRHGHDR